MNQELTKIFEIIDGILAGQKMNRKEHNALIQYMQIIKNSICHCNERNQTPEDESENES